MVVSVAYARILDGAEPEARADCTVNMQPPFAHVAIPAGLHFADQHYFEPLDIDCDAEVIARITAAFEYGLGWCVAQAKARCNVGPGSLQHALLILPVAVWAACIIVVTNVEDGYVRTIKNAFAFVVEVAEFDSRTARARRRGRTDGQKSPKGLAALSNSNPNLSCSIADCSLPGIERDTASAAISASGCRGVTLIANDASFIQINAHDLVPELRIPGQESNGNDALTAAVGEIVGREVWHGRVRCELLATGFEVRIGMHEFNGFAKFVFRRQWRI
jgi:hypothetical protein